MKYINKIDQHTQCEYNYFSKAIFIKLILYIIHDIYIICNIFVCTYNRCKYDRYHLQMKK